MKVALVHDYLREYGGAERVLESLHEIFPDAPVYVSFFDKKALGKHAERFAGWQIHETKITELPLYKRLFSPYRVLAAWAFELLDLSQYDLVISSTNAYQSKAVRVKPGAKHMSYVHTPSRALYGYTTRSDWQRNPLFKAVGTLINVWMRYVDYQTAQRPDILIANSRTTQQRIQKFWRRDSIILPPPVALVDRHPPVLPARDREYLLFVGRLVLSKHPELAVQVSNELQVPLKVVGTGVLEDELRRQAGPQVEFLGAVSDQELVTLYQKAKLLLFPAEDEDFGIVPIEAMAVGTPVITHESGEPRFTVQPGKTGDHVPSLDPWDWQKSVKKNLGKNWNHSEIARSVKKFSQQQFTSGLQKILQDSAKS